MWRESLFCICCYCGSDSLFQFVSGVLARILRHFRVAGFVLCLFLSFALLIAFALLVLARHSRDLRFGVDVRRVVANARSRAWCVYIARRSP